jgi:Lipopolysaccharide-assembly
MEDGPVKSAILYLLFFIVALSLSGCAGYRLGPVNPEIHAGEKAIEVIPFNNQTLEPRLGDAVTQALRERLQVDGTYHLASHGAADIVVTGVITGYSRQAVSFLNSDVTTAKNYRIEIVAHVIVRNRSGQVLLDKNVKGYTLTQTGTELAERERQSMPLLAEDLARNITQLLTEGAW